MKKSNRNSDPVHRKVQGIYTELQEILGPGGIAMFNIPNRSVIVKAWGRVKTVHTPDQFQPKER